MEAASRVRRLHATQQTRAMDLAVRARESARNAHVRLRDELGVVLEELREARKRVARGESASARGSPRHSRLASPAALSPASLRLESAGDDGSAAFAASRLDRAIAEAERAREEADRARGEEEESLSRALSELAQASASAPSPSGKGGTSPARASTSGAGEHADAVAGQAAYERECRRAWEAADRARREAERDVRRAQAAAEEAREKASRVEEAAEERAVAVRAEADRAVALARRQAEEARAEAERAHSSAQATVEAARREAERERENAAAEAQRWEEQARRAQEEAEARVQKVQEEARAEVAAAEEAARKEAEHATEMAQLEASHARDQAAAAKRDAQEAWERSIRLSGSQGPSPRRSSSPALPPGHGARHSPQHHQHQHVEGHPSARFGSGQSRPQNSNGQHHTGPSSPLFSEDMGAPSPLLSLSALHSGFPSPQVRARGRRGLKCRDRRALTRAPCLGPAGRLLPLPGAARFPAGRSSGPGCLVGAA